MVKNINIAGFGNVDVKHLVFDYNGTSACDGTLLDGMRETLQHLSEHFDVHVITSDTFGTVETALKGVNVSVKVLKSSNHTTEKEAFVEALGATEVVAFGNGNNDASMLSMARVGIAILGCEGCATATLMASDIVCKSIEEATNLLVHEKRFIATLRQ